MRTCFTRALLAALVLAVLVGLSAPLAPTASAQGPCTTRGDNLTRNGSVTDGGYDTAHGVVANSWNAFLIDGEWPQYDLSDGESANGDIGGSSSQYIFGQGVHFDAGVYQVIAGTQPGASYEFIIGMGFMLRDLPNQPNQKIDDVVFRQAGVDPYGGSDPRSPTIQWGPNVGTGSYGRSLNHPDLRVTFKAMSNQVSVFARVHNVDSSPSDKAFFDVMCLLPRGDIPVEVIEPTPTAPPAATEVPVVQPAAAQPTRRPPTAIPPTPTPPPPTWTPVPALVFTATPEQMALGPATATPERRDAIPQVAAASNSGNNASRSSGDGGDASASGGGNVMSFALIAGSIGIIGIGLLGIVLIGAFAVWRIFIRQVDDALDPLAYPDDQTHYQ